MKLRVFCLITLCLGSFMLSADAHAIDCSSAYNFSLPECTPKWLAELLREQEEMAAEYRRHNEDRTAEFYRLQEEMRAESRKRQAEAQERAQRQEEQRQEEYRRAAEERERQMQLACKKKGVFEQYYQECILDKMPGSKNIIAIQEALSYCNTKAPCAWPKKKSSMVFGIRSANECFEKYGKHTSQKVAAGYIQSACYGLYEDK